MFKKLKIIYFTRKAKGYIFLYIVNNKLIFILITIIEKKGD